MSKILPILFLFLLLFPCAYSSAKQTGGCHCFRDRAYNPADKFVSDSYLLTTVFNTLTADFFSITKKQIVNLKMKGGAQNDDLLIGLYISKHTNNDITELLARKKNNSWQQILAEETVPDSFRKNELFSRIIKGLSDTQAAEEITKEMFNNRFDITPEAVNIMIQNGYFLREIALVLTLATHIHMSPEIIASQYRDKGLSWSEIAHNFGLEPADVGKLAVKPTSNQQ